MVKRICNIVVFFVFGNMLFLNSCQERNIWEEVDCSECFQQEPDSADLIIHLTINSKYPGVLLKIYEGAVDTGDEIYVDTIKSEKYYVYAPVEKFYSAVAVYIDENGKTINVVDGDEMKTRYIYDSCDEDCYIIRGGVFDLRLKY